MHAAIGTTRRALWISTVLVTAALTLAAFSDARGEELPAGTLGEVLASTLERHESLEILEEEALQADLRKSRFLMSVTPDLSLQAYGRRVGSTGSGGEGEEEGGGPVFFPEGTYYGYSFSLTQPLYTGGRALAAYRGAGDLESSVRIQGELARRDLLVAAAESYFAVLAAREVVRIGEQAVVRAERHLELARKRLDLGEGVVTDRLRAEVNLAEVESDLVGFRKALADARDRVKRLAGRPLAAVPAPVDSLPEIEGSIEDLVAEALGARLELEQDRLEVRAANEDVREKKGRFLPALYAAGSYYGSGEEVTAQETGWQAGLVLEIPIYQRAARFYHLKESRSALRQAALKSVGRAKDISLEVSRLANAMEAASVRIGTLRKQAELASENVRLAEKRFSVGLADSLETVDAQTSLLQAEVGLTAERLLFEVAKLRLAKALGRDLFPAVKGAGS
jgi:outer membrane protein